VAVVVARGVEEGVGPADFETAEFATFVVVLAAVDPEICAAVELLGMFVRLEIGTDDVVLLPLKVDAIADIAGEMVVGDLASLDWPARDAAEVGAVVEEEVVVLLAEVDELEGGATAFLGTGALVMDLEFSLVLLADEARVEVEAVGERVVDP
jgi:hypothetical protein